MNNEPVSISTLMKAVRTPIAAKAPLQADKPILIAGRWDFETLGSDARTTQFPLADRAAISRSQSDEYSRGLSRGRYRVLRPPASAVEQTSYTSGCEYTSRLPVHPAAFFRVRVHRADFTPQWKRKSSAPRLANVTLVRTMPVAPLTSIWTSVPTWWLAACFFNDTATTETEKSSVS